MTKIKTMNSVAKASMIKKKNHARRGYLCR